MLVDHDKLEPANIRRHAIGMDCTDKPKAEACADALRRDFPGVSITARPARVESQQLMFEAADLILDVAGEQALSEWLNHWALERTRGVRYVPTIIHGWVAGHGAAAQSFLSTDADFACYRCLQPDHGERPRFDPLRDLVEEPVGACGAIASLPYGPQAPVQAAALVAEHAAHWARGKSRPLLRTIRVDWDATVKRDPVSPKASPKCPACSVE
jgi:molybdopterin/thiamine biosynthesis adenylyltransferase